MRAALLPSLTFLLFLTPSTACQPDAEQAPERGPLGAADSLGSCGLSGDACGQHANDCWCDEACVTNGDCCHDYQEVCLGESTETVSFAVTGYVAGDLLGNRSEAEASWTAACNAWQDGLRNRFGPTVETSCGEASNLASSSFLFVSRPSATLSATVPIGETVIESSVGRTAAGILTGNLAPALASWTAACDIEIDTWQLVYGSRLVGASCAEPTNLASSSRLFESAVQLWLTPLPGERVTGVDYAAGALLGNLEPALVSWRDACLATVTVAAEIGGGTLELAECDARENLASSSRLFASEIAVSFVGTNPIASSPPPVSGELIGNLGEALASWRAACDASLRAIRERDGDRLIGGVCGVPSNTASSSFRFESQPTIWHQQ